MSTTGCLAKAKPHLSEANYLTVLELSAKYRGQGLGVDAAGLRAAEEVRDQVKAELAELSPKAPERRTDTVKRKRVADMTPAELRAALHTDALTGLHNERWLHEHEADYSHVVAFDADSLKWVNDTMGHDSGDLLLKAWGEALRVASDTATRAGGDEFFALAKSQAEADRITAEVQRILDKAVITAQTPSGEVITINGLGVSFGVATDRKAADAALNAHKTARAAAGERAARGEQPPGTTRTPAQGQPPAVDQGQRQDVPGEVAPPGGKLQAERDKHPVIQFGRAMRAAGLELDGSDVLRWSASVGKRGEIHAEMTDKAGHATIYRMRSTIDGEQSATLATVKLDEAAGWIAGARADLLTFESAPAPTEDLDAMFDDLLAEETGAKPAAAPAAAPPAPARWEGYTIVPAPRHGYMLVGEPRGDGTMQNLAEFALRPDGTAGSLHHFFESPSTRELVVKAVDAWNAKQGQAPKTFPGKAWDQADTNERIGMLQAIGTPANIVGHFHGLRWMQLSDNMRAGLLAKQGLPPERKPRAPRTPQVPFVGQTPAQRTAAAAAASAAVNTGDALINAIDGLGALFGGGTPGRLGSGPSFDEQTYAKAKPLFQAALANIKDAAADLKEAMRTVLRMVLDRFGADTAAKMKAYVVRFITDVRDGLLSLAHTSSPDANNADQPIRRDPGAVDDGQEPGNRTPVADGQPGGAGSDQALAGQPPADGGAPGAPVDLAADGTRPLAPDVPGGEGEPGSGDGADGRSGASGEELAPDGTGAGGLAGPARPNYHVADPASLIGGTPKVRFARNRAALEALDAIESEGRTPLPAELDSMAAYIGWGSFGQSLFNGSWDRPRPQKGWEKEDAWLRQRLGKEAWQSAQNSIINAHYTDPPTVTAMWDMLRAMGFKGGRVLEPSMGIGNFYGLMPRDMMELSQLTGIELDTTTWAMAKLLYPDANIQIKGYEHSMTADGFYDLVVGNWPFAKDGPPGVRRYAALNPSLHDFFFLKALDQVRAGGLVVGITSTGTMDKKGRATRMEMARKGELLAAFRLPSGAFEQYAGTAVVTDILVFRKRATPLADPQSESWIELGEFHPADGPKFEVNQYYLDHPENVLGTLNWGDHTTIGRPGMVVDRPENLMQLLGELAGRMPLAAYQPRAAGGDALVAYVSNNTADRQGSITLGDKGALFVVRGDQLAPLADVVKYRIKDAKENVKRDKQLRALIGLRRAYGALIDGERAGVDNVDALRTTLRTQYQAFFVAHGPINGSEGLAILKKARDPFHSTLAALEHKGEPAAILTRSTMRATRKLDNPSVRDAFVTARNESLTLDLAKIAATAKKTEAEVIAELEKTDAIFRTPAGNYEVSDVYLAGNVRRKLHEVNDAIASGQKGLQRNVDALTKVLPKTQPYFLIEAKLGAPWVTHEHYRQFVAELLGVWGKREAEGVGISFVNGSWKVRFADDRLNARPEASSQWGMPRSVIAFDKLITAALNNRPVTIKYKDSDGITFVHEKETTQSNERITLLREEFSKWVWRDPERRVWLEANYNEVMNAVASPRYDGDFLEFPGMALQRGDDPFSLRKHQTDGIWRGLVNGSGLYAHEVGTGKTYTMAGLAVESRRYGLAQKPLIFAHNANSATVAREVNDMYPGAKVLYIDNLTPDTIDLTMRKIANDDWDAVVVPHSLIDRFALKEETLNGIVAEEIAALEQEALDAAAEDNVNLSAAMMDDPEQMKKVRSATAKELVKARNQIKKKVADMVIRSSREGAISFEDLGVDMIIVDEAHEFKKPPLVTKMKMKGLNTATSNRSIALRFLTDYVKSQRNGRGIFTFTGTPITNTLAEIYNQMRYVMDDQMKRDGIKDWDTWFATFADSATNVEITTSGEHEPVTSLSAFVNVAELRRIAGQYMDIVFADDMPEFKPRPTTSGKIASDPTLTDAERNQLLTSRSENPVGRPYKRTITATAAMSNAQAIKHAEIRQLAALFKHASKKDRRDMMAAGHPASPVILETTASNVGLDMRLIDLDADDTPDSKVNRAVVNVLRHYHEHPLATQAIFLERGYSDFSISVKTDAHGVKHKTRRAKFNLVRDITDKLVEKGIPRGQIAVVDGDMSKEARKAVADAMNVGTVRVVIGLTSTLGTGVNMQNNLRAMHHLDAPWMPGELEQRNGRGWRQGNKWDTVFEYRYVTEGLDGKRWQVLRRKANIIERFLKADENLRIIDDEAAGMDDEGSSLDATLAEAAGDPRLLTKAKLAADVLKLETRERMHTIGVAEARAKARDLREGHKYADVHIANLQADEAAYAAGRAAPFTATVGKATIAERAKFDEVLAAHAVATIKQDDKATLLGSIYGFNVYGLWPRFAGGITFEVKGPSAVAYDVTGSLASIEANLRNLTKRASEAVTRRAESVLSAGRMDEAAKLPFQQADALAKKRAMLADLERDLQLNPTPSPAWLRNGATVGSPIWVDGDQIIVEGHRWSAEGYFVITAEGDVPYLDAKDENGFPIYEDHGFRAPIQSLAGAKLTDMEGRQVEVLRGPYGDPPPAPQRLFIKRVNADGKEVKEEVLASTINMPLRVNKQRPRKVPVSTNLRQTGSPEANTADVLFDIARKKKPAAAPAPSDQPFYSELARKIDAAPMNSGPALAWGQYIRSQIGKGVKADEIAWTGIEDWLKLQPGKVAKADVNAFLEANGVQVSEAVLGEPLLPQITEGRSEPGAVKFATYQLPGGTNYREVLLTLPPSVRLEPAGRWVIQDERGHVMAGFDSRDHAERSLAAEGSPAGHKIEEVFHKYDTSFKSDHWDQPNVLAHVRLNDRTDADGNRVLFVEEIQSDWGQAGREKGFFSPEDEAAFVAQRAERTQRRKDIDERYAMLEAQYEALPNAANGLPSSSDSAVLKLEMLALLDERKALDVARPSRSDRAPYAPFVTATDKWVALALKRVIKMAVDEGYDRVAFVTGKQSADRYKLSNQVNSIEWTPTSGMGVPDGSTHVILDTPAGLMRFNVNTDGMVFKAPNGGLDTNRILGKSLADVVGKGMADKIMAEYRGKLDGEDLNIGGEGMVAFYDKIVPSVAKDVLRKVGGEAMGTVDIGARDRKFDSAAGEQEQPNGRPLKVVQHDQSGGLTIELDNDAGYWGLWPDTAEGRANAEKRLNVLQAAYVERAQPQPGFDITDAMREKAAGGLPLFDVARQTRHELPEVTVERDAEGVPTFNGDLVTLSFPQPTERFEVIPGPGQQVMNYAVMPTSGFGVLGHVELLLDKGKVVSLLDIVVDEAGRMAGVGRKVVETLLAAQPGLDLNISNVVESARDFWDKIGVPVQNLEAGAAYDGTLNSKTYRDLIRPGKREVQAARVVSQASRQGYEKARVPQMQAAGAMRALIDQYEAGKVSDGAFIMRTKVLADTMGLVAETKAANRLLSAGERVRDVDHVRAELLKARRRGDLDHETVEFALWALAKNPSLAANLGIAIRKQPEGGVAVGEYNPAAEIIRLFKGEHEGNEVGVHEILHHAERMMPPAMQAAIRKEWAKALAAAIKKGTPEQVEALKHIALAAVGDKASYQALVAAIQEGPLTYEEHYQLVNPSEFWAVNGARLLGEHYAARDSIWERIRVWLRELVQKARALVGLSSTAAVIRSLHYVTDASHFGVERGGRFESDAMLSDVKAVAAMQDIKRAPPQTPGFKHWFKGSKVVDATGAPKVMYHSSHVDVNPRNGEPIGGHDVFDRFATKLIFGRESLDQVGSWFSDSASDKTGAGMYGGGMIYPVYLAIKKPWSVTFAGLWRQAQKKSGQPVDGRPNAKSVAALDEWMDAMDIDGIHILDDTGAKNGSTEFRNQDVWVARRPDQIKSAIGNTGAFDQANPSILQDIARPAGAAHGAETRSPWRDELGRVELAPGAWLYDKLGVGANALLAHVAGQPMSVELRHLLRAMNLEVQKAQETAAGIAKESMALSQGERDMISDIIEQELASGTTPPAHAVQLAAMMSEQFTEQTRELLELDMLTEQTATRWDGKYLPRFYESKLRKQVGDAWADAVRRVTRRKTSVLKGIKGSHLKSRGLWKTIAPDALPDWEALGWEIRDGGYVEGESPEVRIWRDYTREERDAMGEIRDSGFRFVMGYMQSQRDLALGRMFAKMAADPALSARADVAPDDWVKVPRTIVEGTGVNRYGKLAGRFVSPETMAHLSQIEEADSAAWVAYRKAMSLWKEGKTVLNPASHLNNTVGNLTMAHLAGVSYWDAHKYVSAFKDFIWKAPMVKEAREAGLFLGRMSDTELVAQLPKDLRDLVARADSRTAKGAAFVYNMLTLGLRKPLGAAYAAEDTYFRYLLYKDARSRGVEPNAAVDHAQRYIFTYDDLPKGARRVRDFGIPFFAYTYKAIPVLVHSFLTRPDRFLAPAAVLWVANAAAYAIAAGDDDDDWMDRLRKYATDAAYRAKTDALEAEEQKGLPPWMRGTTAMLTRKTIRLGTDALTGLPKLVDVQRLIPGTDLNDVTGHVPGAMWWPQVLTPSHPVISAAMGFMANTDLWSGKKLTDTNDTIIESTGKRADWLWKLIMPSLAPGSANYEKGLDALAFANGGTVPGLPNFMTENHTGIDKMGQPVQPGYAAAQTMGVKVRPQDLAVSERIDESKKAAMIREVVAELRTMALRHKMGNVRPEVLEREREKSRLKIQRLREGLTVDGGARP